MDGTYTGFFDTLKKASLKKRGAVSLFSKLIIKKLIKQVLVGAYSDLVIKLSR